MVTSQPEVTDVRKDWFILGDHNPLHITQYQMIPQLQVPSYVYTLLTTKPRQMSETFATQSFKKLLQLLMHFSLRKILGSPANLDI